MVRRIEPARPASTSCTSTACRASSTSRRSWRPASRCSTTTTTATSTSTSSQGEMLGSGKTRRRRRPAAGRAAQGSAVSQRPDGQPGRHAHAAVHRRHGRRAASTRAATAWGWRPATSTTTAASTSTSPTSAEPAVPQQLRRHVHRRVAVAAAPTIRAWGVSAAFVDYDRDGWLDLYVGNYVHYSIEADTPCTGLTGRRDYCLAASIRAQPDRLYRNSGDGTFADVTAAALASAAQFGPALGVVDRRLQRRRLDRHLRRQRRQGEPAVDQPARRHVQEHGAAVGRRAERRRQARRRAWASTPATSTTTATKTCS